MGRGVSPVFYDMVQIVCPFVLPLVRRKVLVACHA